MGLLSGLFGGNKGTILTESPAGKKQDFLEASPYWDQSTVPVNTFKNKSPYTAKVVSCKRIVGPEATGETCHIIFDHKGNMPYWEGQSYGVIPPGTNPKNGKPHTVRLYSIASSRYGDNMAGKTSSLCVRRATYWDPDMGKEDPAKKGVCSNLCGNQPVRRVHRQFFTKSFLGDGAAVLARSSGEELAPPRHQAGVASMAWRTTQRFSTNAP